VLRPYRERFGEGDSRSPGTARLDFYEVQLFDPEVTGDELPSSQFACVDPLMVSNGEKGETQ
jgi:hypothetical protein